jgi:hypothetical protein
MWEAVCPFGDELLDLFEEEYVLWVNENQKVEKRLRISSGSDHRKSD